METELYNGVYCLNLNKIDFEISKTVIYCSMYCISILTKLHCLSYFHLFHSCKYFLMRNAKRTLRETAACAIVSCSLSPPLRKLVPT